MIRRVVDIWLAPLLVVAILAGGSRTAPLAAGQATQALTAPVETPAATADAITFGPGSFDVYPLIGLPDLSRYQATLKLSFTGKQAGRTSQRTEVLTLSAP